MQDYDLLIVWNDGSSKTIKKVSFFGTHLEKENLFFFKKNGLTSYIVATDVRYFGSKLDWEEN